MGLGQDEHLGHSPESAQGDGHCLLSTLGQVRLCNCSQSETEQPLWVPRLAMRGGDLGLSHSKSSAGVNEGQESKRRESSECYLSSGAMVRGLLLPPQLRLPLSSHRTRTRAREAQVPAHEPGASPPSELWWSSVPRGWAWTFYKVPAH